MAVSTSEESRLISCSTGVPSGAEGMVRTATLSDLGQPAMGVEPPADGRIVPVDRAEVEMDGRRRQARPAANLLQGGLEIVAHLGWTQVLAILDDCQLELVELQLGDQAKGLLQRLPRKAECAASDEHRPLLSYPVLLSRRPLRSGPQPLGLGGHDPCRGRELDPPDPVGRSYRTLRSGERAEAAADPGPRRSRRFGKLRGPVLPARGQDARMPSPVRAGQAGEFAIVLRAVGLKRGQKRSLGIAAHCLGSDLSDHVDIIDPERPGRQHLEPEPRRVQPPRRQIDRANGPQFPVPRRP